MLVSTEARSKGKSHISDVNEPASRLAQAQRQHDELGKLAQQHRAQDSAGDQSGVADVLRSQVEGIKGHTRSGAGSFPELSEPHLLLAGAGGLQATTPATVHISGDEHIALTAGRSVSVTAKKSLLASVLGKISLFAQNLGIKLFAAKGAVEIQAQSDKMALAALKDLSISSTDGRVVITAAKEVWIGAGGSYIQINGNGIVNGSSGPIVEKTPKWSKQGADAQMPSFPPFGTGKPTDDYSHSL